MDYLIIVHRLRLELKCGKMSKFFSNIVSMWGQRIVNVIVPFVSVPLIADAFGENNLAIWLIILQISRQILLLNFGINNSLVRLLAVPKSESSQTVLSVTLSNAFFLLFIVMILMLCINVFYPVDSFLSDQVATKLVYISVIYAAISLPFQVGYGMLAATSNFFIISIVNIFSQLSWLIVLLGATFLFESNLTSLILVYFFIFLIKDIALVWLGWRSLSNPNLSIKFVSVSVIKTILSVSLAAFLLTASVTFLRQGGTIWLGFTGYFEAVTLVSLPMMVVFGLSPFCMVASQLIMPLAALKTKVGELITLKNDVLISARYSVYLSLIILIVFINFDSKLFELWLGDNLSIEKIEKISFYFQVMFTCFSFVLPSAIFRSVLIASGQHWGVTVPEAIVNLGGFVIGVFLANLMDDAAFSIVIGVCSAFLLRAFGFNLFKAKRLFDLRMAELIFQIYLLPVTIFSCLLGINLFLSSYVNNLMFKSLLQLMCIVCLSVLVLSPLHRIMLIKRIKLWLQC